jgi:hypothetical protein
MLFYVTEARACRLQLCCAGLLPLLVWLLLRVLDLH